MGSRWCVVSVLHAAAQSASRLKDSAQGNDTPKATLPPNKILTWILGEPVTPKLKMKVGARRNFAGVATDCNSFTALHAISNALQKLLVVLVDGKIPFGMLHGNCVPAVLRPIGKNDVPVANAPYWGPHLDSNVDGKVSALCIEPSGEEAIDGRAQGQRQAGRRFLMTW